MKRALDRSLVKTSRQYLLVHELKDILTDEFAEVSVEHVSRICNAVAHELASLGSFFQASFGSQVRHAQGRTEQGFFLD